MRSTRTLVALAAVAALVILGGCGHSGNHGGGGGGGGTPKDGGSWVAIGHEKQFGGVTVQVVSAYDQDCELIVRDQRTSQRLGMTQGETTTVLGAAIEILTTRKNAGVSLHVTPG
jgi:hypothetical protein